MHQRLQSSSTSFSWSLCLATTRSACAVVCSGQPGFDGQCHTTPKCRQQFHLHVTRHSHDRLALNYCSRAHTDHDESHVCFRRASAHVLAGVPVSQCNEGVASPVRVDTIGVQAVVTPCLSALWDLDFLLHGCRWVHHSFEGLLFQPSCPPMSQTVSSRLLCSTLSTLKPMAGMAVTAVSNIMRWSILRHQDSPSRSSSPSRGVCAKRDSYVCGMPAGHDKVEHRVCVQRVLVCSAKVAMFNDPFWFQILFGTVSALTGQANNCWVSSSW